MGEVLAGRYEVLGVAARGGQSEVLRARRLGDGAEVAIKRRPLAEPGAREEASALLSLAPHPNLPDAVEAFEHEGGHHLVLGWLPGPTLAAALDVGGGMSFAAAFPLLEQLAGAIDHLHAHGLVHGDVAPGNVILADRPVLIDLGLARGGARIGTAGFRSPEVSAGAERRGAADVFGLSATAVAILTGRAPSPGEEPDLARVPAVIRQRVRDALRDGLHPDPAARPRSAGDLVERMRPPPVPTNLPAATEPIVGRARELSRIATLLAAGRIVTLVGPGGIGKSRLAVEAARALTMDHPGGVWLVELTSVREPAGIAAAAAAACGIHAPGGDPAAALSALLAHDASIVLLDNCEHVIEGCRDLVGLLRAACPETRVIATSRDPLALEEEHLLVVPPLRSPLVDGDAAADLDADSITLFLLRAAAVDASVLVEEIDRSTIAEAVARLDGMPLAIELAAAAGTMPLSSLARSLADAGGATSSARRSLGETLGWSIDRLTESQRHLFARLSVFASGWTREAAAAVCGFAPLTRAGVRRDLDVVARAFLVQKAEGLAGSRYAMLEPIRLVAVERADAEVEQLRDRHAAYFAALPDRAARRGRVAMLDLLEDEIWNLRLAFEHLAARDGGDEALRLAEGIAPLWGVRASMQEGIGWFERALAGAGPDADTLQARLHLAELLRSARRNEQAAALAEEVERDARSRGDRSVAAGALILTGRTHPDYARAIAILEQAAAAARAIPNEETEGKALAALAEFRFARAEVAEARAAALRAVRLAGVADAPSTLSMLSQIETASGRLLAARRAAERGIRAAARSGSARGLLTATFSLANVETSIGDTVRARHLFSDAVELARRSGDPLAMAVSRASLAMLDRREGRTDAALHGYREALRTFRALGADWSVGLTLGNIGGTLVDVGAYEEAHPSLEEGLAIARRLGNALDEARIHTSLARIAAAGRDAGRARDLFAGALSVALAASLDAAAAEALAHWADMEADAGDAALARRLAATAMRRDATSKAISDATRVLAAEARPLTDQQLTEEIARAVAFPAADPPA